MNDDTLIFNSVADVVEVALDNDWVTVDDIIKYLRGWANPRKNASDKYKTWCQQSIEEFLEKLFKEKWFEDYMLAGGGRDWFISKVGKV